MVKAPGLVPALKKMTQTRIPVYLAKAAIMVSSGFVEVPCCRVRLKATESPQKSASGMCGWYIHTVITNMGGLIVT